MAVLSCDFLSKTLGRTVSFTAIIPMSVDVWNDGTANYAPKPFKTLYLLHGITGNHTDWLYGTRVAHYAEHNNVAVIMPSGENGFYTANTDGNDYGEYVGVELVNATRAMFNLSRNKDDTSIGGLSMGGYGAIRNGLKYSDTFGRIIGLSSALIVEDAKDEIKEGPVFFRERSYLEKVFGDLNNMTVSDVDVKPLADKNAEKVKIYLACGTEDFLLRQNRDYRDYLEKINADFIYEEGSGGHDWEFWDRYIKKSIEWICQ